MILNAYSIRDKFAQFSAPFFCGNDFVAKRNFMFTAMNPETVIHAAPGDFDLYAIGSFNDETGELLPAVPSLVISAQNAIAMALSERSSLDEISK